MRITLVSLLAGPLLSGVLLAQDYSVPRGSAIYIEKMEGDLNGYITAEFVKQKVPLRIVTTEEDAKLIMTGTATGSEKRSWHEGWLTAEKDKTTGNIMLIDKATKTLLWASEAGDRSMWWGAMARGGPRKVASRLVKNLKKAIK
jgi:hypothetical protein